MRELQMRVEAVTLAFLGGANPREQLRRGGCYGAE